MNIPLSESEYGTHKELRKKFVYMDTLVHNEVWSDSLVLFNEKIQKYLHARNEHGLVQDNSVKMLGIPEHKINESVFTTIVSDIIHYNISMNIGKYIKDHYEHYKPIYKRDIPINKTSDVTEVEKIIQYLQKNKKNISKIQENFRTNIKNKITGESVSYYNNYLQEPKKSIDKITNISLDEYNVYTNIIGYDISKNMEPEMKQSLSLVTSSILGWDMTSLEERCIGSPEQFGSILMDIMCKSVRTSNTSKMITDSEKGNCEYLWNLGKNYYEPILSMKMDNIKNKNNPFQIGIINYEYKKPDMFFLWSLWNILDTPFYDRTKIQPKAISVPFDKILYYKPVRYGISMKLEMSEPTFDSGVVNEMKKVILQAISGNENTNNKFSNKVATNNSCLLTDFMKISTNINQSLNQNNLDISSITKLVYILENVDDKKWFTIISLGLSIVFLNLILAFDTDWDNITKSYNMINNIKFPLSRKQYIVQDQSNKKKDHRHHLNIFRKDIIDYTYILYDKYISNLKDILGNKNNNIVGGLSLKGNNVFRLQRMGKTIVYPGDEKILEVMQNYITLLDNDLSKIQNILHISFSNIQTKYWYRDVLKWVDTMFYVFKPKEQYGNSPKTETEVKTGFANVEKILKNLHSKKIEYMKRKIDFSTKNNLENQSDILEITIYYIQRQINIIMHILDNILLSWWVSENPYKSRGNKTAFDSTIFKNQFSLLKINIDNFINNIILQLSSTYSTPIIQFHNKLKNELHISAKSITPVINEKNNILEISTNQSIWDTTFQMLYTISNASFDRKKILIYLPVTKKGKLYLFNIVNYILKGKYKEDFIKNDNWLTETDFRKKKFKTDAFVIVTDKQENITNSSKWIEYKDNWLENIYKDDTIKFPTMLGMYLFFTNPSVLQNMVKSKMTNLEMVNTLTNYMELSNTQKKNYQKNVKLTSVENISVILNKVIRDKYK